MRNVNTLVNYLHLTPSKMRAQSLYCIPHQKTSTRSHPSCSADIALAPYLAGFSLARMCICTNLAILRKAPCDRTWPVRIWGRNIAGIHVEREGVCFHRVRVWVMNSRLWVMIVWYPLRPDECRVIGYGFISLLGIAPVQIAELTVLCMPKVAIVASYCCSISQKPILCS